MLGSLAAVFFPPAVDLLVIAAQQDRRHIEAAVLPRAGVLGAFEPSPRCGEGIVCAAVFVSQDARHEPDRGVNNRHRGDFAPVEDVIADGNLVRLEDQPDSFVKSLVTAAQQQDPPLPGQFFDFRLVEAPALGREHHQATGLVAVGLHRLDALDSRLDLDHHTGPAPEGAIVDRVMFSFRPIADIVQPDLHQPGVNCPLQQALAQVSLEDFGKEGQNVEPHGNRSTFVSLLSVRGDICLRGGVLGRGGCRALRGRLAGLGRGLAGLGRRPMRRLAPIVAPIVAPAAAAVVASVVAAPAARGLVAFLGGWGRLGGPRHQGGRLGPPPRLRQPVERLLLRRQVRPGLRHTS